MDSFSGSATLYHTYCLALTMHTLLYLLSLLVARFCLSRMFKRHSGVAEAVFICSFDRWRGTQCLNKYFSFGTGARQVLLSQTTIWKTAIYFLSYQFVDVCLHTVMTNHPTSGLAAFPNELLLEIFQHLVFSDDRGWRTLEPATAPILLTHVCHRWKQIVEHFPSFWNAFCIQRSRKALDEELVQVVSHWIQLSQPLNVELRFGKRVRPIQGGKSTSKTTPANIPDPWTYYCRKRSIAPEGQCGSIRTLRPGPLHLPDFIPQVLQPVKHSLTSLALSQVPIAEIVALPQGLFPTLERLVLCFNSAKEVNTFPWSRRNSVRAFGDAPCLRRVALRRFYRGYDFDFVELPWGQLTHFIEFQARDGPFYFIWKYLPICENLRFLHLTEEGTSANRDVDTARVNGPPCVAPNLRGLSLVCSDEKVPLLGLGIPFVFDNLQSIRLIDWDPILSEEEETNSLLVGKLKKFTGLQRLAVTMANTDGRVSGRGSWITPVLSLLSAVPSISTLEIDVMEDLFFILAPGGTRNDPILPNLRHLVINACRENDDVVLLRSTAKGFEAFLDARNGAYGKLERITILLKDAGSITPRIEDFKLNLLECAWGVDDFQVHVEVLKDLGPNTLRKIHLQLLSREEELQDWDGIVDLDLPIPPGSSPLPPVSDTGA